MNLMTRWQSSTDYLLQQYFEVNWVAGGYEIAR